MRLCFATGNLHKLAEVRDLLHNQIEVVGLDEIGFQGEIPEDHETMEENSLQKAMFIHDRYGISCFADDSGLEVKALNGAPGVYSARYAGPGCTSQDNINKLLKVMEGIEHREGRFRAVISLVLEGEVVQFEGTVNGRILTEERGVDGFGYDPIFVPDGYDQTFAEMASEEKNKISHRGEAIGKLVDHLNSLKKD